MTHISYNDIDSHSCYAQTSLAKDSETAFTAFLRKAADYRPQPGETLTEPLTGIELVWIPPGRFRMGACEEDLRRGWAYEWELPPHEVDITPGFWMGKYPVTQAQWVAIMKENPSRFTEEKSGNDWQRYPAEGISWYGAQEFLSRVGVITAHTLNAAMPTFRLPTEAEWEYACRAGTNAIWPFGNDDAYLEEHAWYDENSERQTHPVGQKRPNAWGLYDMQGNVWEWCADWYNRNIYQERGQHEPVLNPTGPKSGQFRVIRGGGYGSYARLLRAADRGFEAPSQSNAPVGFRLLMTPYTE
ncbi:hypothetical protein U14_02000 [Candidatus Moduliflexus flocculans]|uniref:Sulfatase-modifying factor enzyme-like domain-containing protein n=1 Tax=Candidatus Moduliflexus flocculans TaxID=1499966 RepID=A0A0S6VTK9_9BACT|nr:hypothetical protein U14_02000 [Candidatus Moduliflexus flocculans]